MINSKKLLLTEKSLNLSNVTVFKARSVKGFIINCLFLLAKRSLRTVNFV